MTHGIILDAETAALVRVDDYSTRLGECDGHWWPARAGDVLLRHGGRPVDELVAAHDEGKARAARLRSGSLDIGGEVVWAEHLAEDLEAAADFLDAQMDALIDPRLVAAYKVQRAADGAGS